MKRFIITGSPGAGKTAIIRQLECEGFSVVEEAATDIIAAEQAKGIREPWKNLSFTDAIARLQKQRELRNADFPGEVQFYDRSVVCTAALAAYLGHGFSPFLSGELQRIKNGSVYELQVFFIRNLGFITQTAARRITFEENLRFEKVHEDTYRRLGFTLCYVERGTVSERVQNIREAIQRRTEKARLSLARR